VQVRRAANCRDHVCASRCAERIEQGLSDVVEQGGANDGAGVAPARIGPINEPIKQPGQGAEFTGLRERKSKGVTRRLAVDSPGNPNRRRSGRSAP
jgi:hypothetical protein